MGMTRARLALLAVAGLVLVVGVVRIGRDQGAFGCDYQDRQRTAAWRLNEDVDPSVLRVRKGEGVSLASPERGALRDVLVSGDAGLAEGTQNGVNGFGYVFRVTGAGRATVTGHTASGHVVRAALRATC